MEMLHSCHCIRCAAEFDDAKAPAPESPWHMRMHTLLHPMGHREGIMDVAWYTDGGLCWHGCITACIWQWCNYTQLEAHSSITGWQHMFEPRIAQA